MTTYAPTTVTCANCGKKSEQYLLTSSNKFGSSDLDLRPPPMMRDTMRVWLQQCPHCQYIAPNLEQMSGDSKRLRSAEYKTILANGRFPDLARRFLAHALLFE